MQNHIDRRSFLTLAAGLGVGLSRYAAWGVDPFERPGPARLWMSLAAYSFRDHFVKANQGQSATVGKQPARTLDLFQFIDFCAEHGCHGTELTSYYFPPKFDTAFLLRLRRHAYLRGVEISGTAVGNSFTVAKGPKRQEQIDSVKLWIDHAALMGAPHIRVFAGDAGALPLDQAKSLCIEALEECAAYAGTKGIFLGIENHGGIVARPQELLEIVQAVKSPWVGINLDTGNFHTADPYADLRKCAPYAVNVQIKVEIQRSGAAKEQADLKQLVDILRSSHYQGYVALEYEAAEDPWVAVPRWLGQLKPLLTS